MIRMNMRECGKIEKKKTKRKAVEGIKAKIILFTTICTLYNFIYGSSLLGAQEHGTQVQNPTNCLRFHSCQLFNLKINPTKI